MRLKLKTPPASEPVTLTEAKNHLKVDTSDDDSLISSLITAARDLAERETRRAFITQTWQMYLDSVAAEFEIPKPPLQSVESIKVVDQDGNETTVDSSYYDVDLAQNSPGRVKLKSGCCWPTHRGFASFIIEFKAGYGDAATDVPEALKQGLFVLMGHMYENRGSEGVVKARVHALDEARILFAPFKIWTL
ncbi:MAG: phage head-tail connector protein [Candidatus Hydrogenedentota bacterium]|nr:MAG: phage head-tail connector protein [Candidatus Hydrogenedentota bacterium]